MFITFSLFFFNATATTEIYTLSLHDALPISLWDTNTPFEVIEKILAPDGLGIVDEWKLARSLTTRDRKSTRLNSSHTVISYAVFCLKKKKQQKNSKINNRNTTNNNKNNSNIK